MRAIVPGPGSEELELDPKHAQDAIGLGLKNPIRLSKTADTSAPICSGSAVHEGRYFQPATMSLPENFGGADRDRTDDLRLAKPALSQLSYSPSVPRASQPLLVGAPFPGSTLPANAPMLRIGLLVGLGRFELPTSRLSGGRSNQLSYRPSTPGAPNGARRPSEPESKLVRSPKTE